jgi:hypothetical protein
VPYGIRELGHLGSAMDKNCPKYRYLRNHSGLLMIPLGILGVVTS